MKTHRFSVAAAQLLVAAGMLGAASSARAQSIYYEYTLPHPTSPAPSSIDTTGTSKACYIDSPNNGIGIATSMGASGGTLDYFTLSGASLSEHGIKCQGTSYLFAADTTNNEIVYIDLSVPQAYYITALGSGDGGPYAVTSTGASASTVWFSTYTTASNSTVYIGSYAAGGSLQLYPLPSAVAGPNDKIDGLEYVAANNTWSSGAIAFTVYGSSHKSGNYLDLSCGSGICTVYTLPWPTGYVTTSETQVALDGNGYFDTALGSGSDSVLRWDYVNSVLHYTTDSHYSFTGYIANDTTWSGTYSGTDAVILYAGDTTSVSVTKTSHTLTVPSATTPMATSFGTYNTYTISTVSTGTPSYTSGTTFSNNAPVGGGTIGAIANVAGGDEWCSENAAGKIVLYE